MKNKKGFTLIELLAVIIILGILMIIAIPSVTKYISDSRKNTYVDTAKELISGARNMVNNGKLGMYDTNSTYYIPSSCIKVENGNEADSPYGKFTKAYIGVIYDGKGYRYYWTSVDETGQGVNKIIPLDKLDAEDIESDLKDSDIEEMVKKTGIGDRSEIKILNCNTNSWDGQYHLDDISNNVSEENGGGSSSGSGSIVVYPTGKTKANVEVGEEVSVENEEFYVIGREGNNLVLITKYLIDVSDDPDKQTTGHQKASLTGFNRELGGVKYSNEDYWGGNIGSGKRYPGKVCTETYQYEGCAYVYDENSNVKQYVDAYANYLESLGMEVKEARLINKVEIYNLRNSEQSSILFNGTNYWTGSPYLFHKMVFVSNNNTMIGSYDANYGVRPIIVI